MAFKKGDTVDYAGQKAIVQQAALDGSWLDVRGPEWKHGKRVRPADLKPVTPTVREVDKVDWSSVNTLCDRCSKATAIDCLFLGMADPVKALEIIGAHAVSMVLSGGAIGYRVVDCPPCLPGPLPPLEPRVVTVALKRLVKTGL